MPEFVESVQPSFDKNDDDDDEVNNSIKALVERHASWVSQSAMSLDDKTADVFKALGGKAGTRNTIPKQFIEYLNVRSLQLKLIADEHERIIYLERIVRDFGIANARVVLPDTMAILGQVLVLLDFPALYDGERRPLEPDMSGFARQTSLRAVQMLFVNIFQAMGLTRKVARHITMGILVFADVLMVGLPSNFASKYPSLIKRLLTDTRDATCQILRNVIEQCHPDLCILTFGKMSLTNGHAMLQSIGHHGKILNDRNLSHPMCGNRGWTTTVQRNYIVETALKAANKVALRLGLIEKELSIEILSQHRVDISNLYSVSPGVILREQEAKNESAPVKFSLSLAEREAKMKAEMKAEREAKKAKKEAEREECIAAEAKKAKKEAERAAAIESAPVIFKRVTAVPVLEERVPMSAEERRQACDAARRRQEQAPPSKRLSEVQRQAGDAARR